MASTCMARGGGCLDIVDATTTIVTMKHRHDRYWPQLDKDFLERVAMNKRPERELCPRSPYCNPIGRDHDDDHHDVPEHFLDLSWVRRQEYLRSYTFSKNEGTVVDRKTTKNKYDLTKKTKKKKKANYKSDRLVKEIGGKYSEDDGKHFSLLESIFAVLFICVARGSSTVANVN